MPGRLSVQAYVAKCVGDAITREITIMPDGEEGVHKIEGAPGWSYRVWRGVPIDMCTLFVVMAPDLADTSLVAAQLNARSGYQHGYVRLALVSVISLTAEERAELEK